MASLIWARALLLRQDPQKAALIRLIGSSLTDPELPLEGSFSSGREYFHFSRLGENQLECSHYPKWRDLLVFLPMQSTLAFSNLHETQFCHNFVFCENSPNQVSVQGVNLAALRKIG